VRTVAPLLLIAACSSPDVLAARKLPSAVQPAADAVVAATNQLACDVYAKLPAGNAVFSPFSIATSLAMVDAGAAGQTDSELRAALHLTLPSDQVATAYDALLTSLDTGRSYGAYTLATADRLFGQQGFAFLPSYLDTTNTGFHAPLEPVDFASNPDGARTTINSWVATQTDGKIPELFPANSIDAATRLVVANAIVFKGDWARQFDPQDTHLGTFHVSGGADVSTLLMNAEFPIALGRLDIPAQYAVLPFRGNDLSFVIVLPDDPDGLPAVEAQLTPATLATAFASAPLDPSEDNHITLPKFTITLDQNLTSLLGGLGIVAAFIPDQADLSGIDGTRDLYLAQVIHDATITVDEHGAEAAAATGGDVKVTALPPSITVDHSFIFLIHDNVTGSILFMGRVLDPRQP